MEIILLENVGNLGRKGEIVSVKDGYARNYLVPSGLAVYVTAESLRRAELLKKKYIQEEMERRGALKELAAKLGTVSITISAKASEEGHLFGSVGAAQIADALRADGYDVEERMIQLPEPIKELARSSHESAEYFGKMQQRLVNALVEHPALKERVERLMSIPGAGEMTALTWALEIDDPHRFKTVKKAISYCGLCSSEKESAGRRRRAPLSKQRNSHSSRKWLTNSKPCLMSSKP